MPNWLGSAIDFGIATASAAGVPLGAMETLVSPGYSLYDKISEKKQAVSLIDKKLIDKTQAAILRGWLTEARGHWLTEADAKAADALLDAHLAGCLPDLPEMAALAGDDDRVAATVALTLEKLQGKDGQFRENPLIRRFAEEVLTLIVAEVSARAEFRSLLVTYDVQEIALRQKQDRERDEAFQARSEADQAEMRHMLQELLARTEKGEAAISQGIDPDVIVAIAARLSPDVRDAEQAILALERAAEELLRLREERVTGSNLGELVDEAVRRIAERIEANDLDGAQAEGEKAFADWRGRQEEAARREAERREVERARGIKLAAETERAAYFAGGAANVAAWTEARLELEANTAEAPIDALWRAFTEWFRRGRDKGLNLDLEVAVEIAHKALTRPSLSVQDRGKWQHELGNALGVLGARDPVTNRLERAIEAFRQALLSITREREPLHWATAQNDLGNVLFGLGERQVGTARLEQAVATYRCALLERTRERVPLDWALTQSNLGNALFALGNREPGTALLEESKQAFTMALLELTREHSPIEWATTQNNLGNALAALGIREVGTSKLEKAVEAYEQALLERTRELLPLEWAATQTNLGGALLTIGERTGSIPKLTKAIDAYEKALLERTRDRVPLDWAATQFSLGNALTALGLAGGGSERLEQAVAAFRRALLERTRDRVPLIWANTQNSLGNALWGLGIREAGTDRLEQAIDAYRRALSERIRDRLPLEWAGTMLNLCIAEAQIAERRRDRAPLAAIEARAREARQVLAEGGHAAAAAGWGNHVLGEVARIRKGLDE